MSYNNQTSHRDTRMFVELMFCLMLSTCGQHPHFRCALHCGRSCLSTTNTKKKNIILILTLSVGAAVLLSLSSWRLDIKQVCSVFIRHKHVDAAVTRCAVRQRGRHIGCCRSAPGWRFQQHVTIVTTRVVTIVTGTQVLRSSQ